MVRTDDELALREALMDVTTDQPVLPVDRVAGVRRKHARRRQLQGVAGACAVAVVAAGAVALGGTLHTGRTTQSLSRPVPSWAVQWDDHRDGSVPQQVLDSAVSSWVGKQLDDAPLPRTQPTQRQPVVWYVGNRIPGTDQVLAVFEVSGLHAGALPLTQGTRLVVAQAAWDDVKNASASGDRDWQFTDVAAPAHNYAGFIGSYIPVNDVNGVHNVVWLLTSPSYRRVQTSVGGKPLRDGFTTFDAGALQIRVEASFQDASGRYPAGGYVGIPGAPASQVPTLANPEPLTQVPSGGVSLGEAAGQGSAVNSNLSANAPVGRPTKVYARCYTAGPQRFIRVAVDRQAATHGVRIPCDLREHVVPGNVTGPSIDQDGHSFAVQASGLTAWRVAVVIN